MRTILIVGATGRLGGTIARRALAAGHKVRILVRPQAHYDDLVEAGAEALLGDLKDPASLARVCRGIDAVITTANSARRGGTDTFESVDLRGNLNLIDAAAAAKVSQFVFTSLLGADPHSPNPLVAAKGRSEEHLRASGVQHTILQPNIFMDVWINAIIDSPLRTHQAVTLIGSGRARHSFIAERDVAAFAVGALDNPRAANATIQLGGPRPLSWRDVVAAYEMFLGYPVTVNYLTPGSALPGAPDFMATMLAFLDTYESPIDTTRLAQDFKVTLTPVETYIRESIAAWN